MKVKVKNPKRVYFDREQQKTFTGEELIETKATQAVRQLLNDGSLLEVHEADVKAAEEAKAKEEAAAETLKNETPAQKKAREAAELKAAKAKATAGAEGTSETKNAEKA